MTNPMKFTVEDLTNAQVDEIRSWPPYPDKFAALDYGLRAGGWLDLYPGSSDNRRFGGCLDGRLIGFSLLTHLLSGPSEFYLAIHPGQTGGGFGRKRTAKTLEIGFIELNLPLIYLRVRQWHVRAIALYESLGFRTTGSSSEMIDGQMVDLFVMEIHNPNHCKAECLARPIVSGFLIQPYHYLFPCR